MSEYTEIDDFIADYYADDYYEETALDIFNNCAVLSVLSILPTLANIVLLNLSFGFLARLGYIPITVLHILSGGIGIYLLHTLALTQGRPVLLGCFATTFLLLQLSLLFRRYCNPSNALKVVLIVLLVLCEYFLIETEVWAQIRGIVMILVMKTISLADDIEKTNNVPGLAEYFGYLLCGANIMLGPWIPFQEYMNLYTKTRRKDWFWIVQVIYLVVTSIFFLTLSNCWSGYFITDTSNRWLIAYKEAFAFRTSHYFISYLAEAGMLSSGFARNAIQITEPFSIEFPSSLSVVVRKWNQPMHDFLKKYIYKSWLKYGKFPAVLATFLISSLFHGLELKVSLVLVSIGTFSYLQVAPRDKISEVFDCCLRVRPCKDCKHKYKRDNIRVKIALFTYSIATIFHLAYLGVLMDPSTDEVGVYAKWQHLYFISHIIMAFNFMIIL